MFNGTRKICPHVLHFHPTGWVLIKKYGTNDRIASYIQGTFATTKVARKVVPLKMVKTQEGWLKARKIASC